VTFVYSAISSIDLAIGKTARALGAGAIRTALLIVREGKNGILIALMAAFGRAISEVGISMILGGNVRGFTRNITTAIALEHNKGNFAFALALGLILLTIVLGINFTVYMVAKRSK